ncbi:MAG: helix-turn-helix domain-containing protein [Ruminococcaceae bacterium]|nr:helix-turn-helix domain-containing protein [Oscillospiraceae bacterium]
MPSYDYSGAAQTNLLTVFRSSLTHKRDIFTEHHHTAFEITMVLSGSGIYSTKTGDFSFEKDDIFFFSTDEFHWIKHLNSNAEFLNIHFEPRFIWSENFGFSNKELIKIFFSRKKKPLNKIPCNENSALVIRNLIFNIENEIALKKQEYETMLKVHIVNILVEIMRYCEGQLSEHDVSYSTQSLKYMEDALNYIDEHIESELTLETLSDVAHMSKTYFCCQFRKLNGISPWEYITIKRIERAILYIESTNLTRLEIATKCGYNNTANFYHAFKRVTGKTPGDYKKLSTDILPKRSQ